MQTRVPSRLEPEHGSIIASNLQHLSREEAEGKDAPVFVIIEHGVGAGPDPADHQLPDVPPAQLRQPLVDNGQPDATLETVVEEELSTTGQVIAVVHEHRHVLPTTRQLQHLEPDDQVVLRVDLVGCRAALCPVLAAPHWLADGDGWREEAAGRGPGCALSALAHLRPRPTQGVLLVVAVHLEDDGLALHVLNEGPEAGLEQAYEQHLVTVTVMFCTW